MLAYLARRLSACIMILVGVSIVTCLMTVAIPADPVAMIAGRNSTPEVREQIRHQLGLDKPLYQQYLTYAGNLVQGNLGRSYARKSDVGPLIASRLPPTILLMLASILAEVLIGIPAGIYAATRRGKPGDKIAMTLSFLSVGEIGLEFRGARLIVHQPVEYRFDDRPVLPVITYLRVKCGEVIAEGDCGGAPLFRRFRKG